MLATAVVAAVAFALSEYGFPVARKVFAFTNASVFVFGATLAALSLVRIIRHRRWSFAVDFAIGAAGVVFMMAWLIPMYGTALIGR